MTVYRIYAIGMDRRATLRKELHNSTDMEALRVALGLLRTLPEEESCLLDCDPEDDDSPDDDAPLRRVS